jgi:hypothetical protein
MLTEEPLTEEVNPLQCKRDGDLFIQNDHEETAIFWDWDDTLLCSSFLSNEGLRLDSQHISDDLERQLKELEASVIAVLELSLTYGEVYVVTNAETGWVQLSAQKFLPGVVSILEQVNVLSARSTFEALFPNCPIKWKYCAFVRHLGLPNPSVRKNVLSFGDSHVEREAVRMATRDREQTRTKSVKFAERPSIEQLRRQIELVTKCFESIHRHEGNLDLALTVSNV